MNETMNLNGMGVGDKRVVVNNIPQTRINNSNVELQGKQSSIPVSSNVSSQPQPINTNQIQQPIQPQPVQQQSVLANNEMNFDNLDMIKALRAEEEANRKKNDNIFSSMDFGPLKKYLDDDDVTDISYSNGGQLWLKTLSKGVYRVDEEEINDALIEKIAFQCSNVMGKTFNMAHPFLDSESSELRMNFIHDSIARNGIAVVFRKTPAKIRLEKDKLMKENYVSLSIHDFLIKAVQGHCNIIMCGETGSGKTEFLKYLASHTFENEKIVTVEDTLELHLDRIYPHRDIVAMKTNNVASYSDVLVTCMRQNPIWILLSEVRSAEAVTAVRNSISSGHFILSTIHADKAANIPYRLYSLLESNIDVEQFLNTIYRYVQLGVFLRGRFDPKQGRYVREIGEVTEFYVNDNNECVSNTIYQKTIKGDVTYKPISDHLLNYLEGQGIDMTSIRAANGDLEKAQSYSDDINKSEENGETGGENKSEVVENTEQETPKEETIPQEQVTPINEVVQQPISIEMPKEEVAPQEPTVVAPMDNALPPINEVVQQPISIEIPKEEAAPKEPTVVANLDNALPPINEVVQQPVSIEIPKEEVVPQEPIVMANLGSTLSPAKEEIPQPIDITHLANIPSKLPSNEINKSVETPKQALPITPNQNVQPEVNNAPVSTSPINNVKPVNSDSFVTNEQLLKGLQSLGVVAEATPQVTSTQNSNVQPVTNNPTLSTDVLPVLSTLNTKGPTQQSTNANNSNNVTTLLGSNQNHQMNNQLPVQNLKQPNQSMPQSNNNLNNLNNLNSGLIPINMANIE